MCSSDLAERTIMSSELMQEGYFSPEYIAGLFTSHRSGKHDNALYIWTLFNLFAWHSYWIEGKEVRGA